MKDYGNTLDDTDKNRIYRFILQCDKEIMRDRTMLEVAKEMLQNDKIQDMMFIYNL